MSGFNDKALQDMFSTGKTTDGGIDDKRPAFKPGYDSSKKQGRLRAGVTPKWAGQVIQEQDDGEESNILAVKAPVASLQTETRTQPVDRRLALAARKLATNTTGGEDAPIQRRIYDAEVVTEELTAQFDADTQSESKHNTVIKEELDDDEERQRMRRAQSQRLKQQNTVVEEVMRKEEEEEEESGSSEYETDTDSSEEEDGAADELPKPVFISRQQREKMQEERDAEAEAMRRKQISRKKAQQKVSRSMVAESIRRQDTIIDIDDDNDSDAGLPDDTDGIDPEAAQEEWQIRELQRLQRDIEEKKIEMQEQQDLQTRRAMTDEQIEEFHKIQAAEKAKNDAGNDTCTEVSGKRYHKGAFFMDNLEKDDVRNRDTSGMTASEASFKLAASKRNEYGGVKDASLKRGTISYEANSWEN